MIIELLPEIQLKSNINKRNIIIMIFKHTRAKKSIRLKKKMKKNNTK